MVLKNSKRKKIKRIILIINLIIIPVFFVMIPKREQFYSLEKWCLAISLFLLILLFFQIVSLKLIMPKRRHLIPVILSLFYLFMFSHVFLKGINYPVEESVGSSLYVFTKYSEPIVVEVVNLCINAALIIYCGIFLFFLIKKSEEQNSLIRHTHYFSNKTKLLLILVGLVFDGLYNFLLFRASRAGYGATATADVSFILRLLSFFLLSGVSACLVDNNLSLRKKTLIFVMFVAYRLVTMLTGVRAYSLISIFIAGYLFVLNSKISKIRLRHILLGVLLIHVFGSILLAIRETREIGSFQLSVLNKYLFSLKSNIVFELMAENGVTLNTVCEVFLSNKSGNGGQFISSLLSIIPGISYITGLDFEKVTLDTALNLRSIGGSYVADILFDFGNTFTIWCFAFGVFLAFTYELYEMILRNSKCFSVALMTPLIVELTFCVRSSLSRMPRTVVWYLLLLGFVYIFVNGLNNKKIIISYDVVQKKI